MRAYYNEFDPKAAAWLRQLIKNGDIAPGEVDERSIIDVSADDLIGFTQHHFFAGIGVWSYALRNAGWSDDRPVCTASLPCQPFSSAGRHKGKDDERHLLPHFLHLVSQCGFNTIFGEQVESAIRHGWLDDLHTEMEAQGYAVGHAVLGAHSAGGFHQRQRLFWVAQQLAHTSDKRLQGHRGFEQVSVSQGWKGEKRHAGESGMGNAEHNGQPASTFTRGNEAAIYESKTGAYSASEPEGASPSGTVSGEFSGLGYTSSLRRQQQPKGVSGYDEGVESAERQQILTSKTGCDASDIEWLYCRDEKYRAIKSGLKPLVDGSAAGVGYSGDPSQPIDADYSSEARVMRLKGYGNAIHAGTAQMFIEAFIESSD